MAEFPPYVCRNPSCGSFGKSHPHCKCGAPSLRSQYGALEYAEGGEIESFCSQSRSHEKGCEYFKEGGEVRDPALDRASGVSALGSAVSGGLFHGNDPVANSMLHAETGDPAGAISAALAHIGGAKLLGAAKDSDASKKLKQVEESKLRQRAEKLLAKIGSDKSHVDPDKIKPHIQNILGKQIGDKEHGKVGHAVIKMLSSGNLDGFHGGIEHADSIHKGSNKIDDRIKDLFENTGKKHPLLGSDSNHDRIKKHIEEGHQDKQMDAEVRGLDEKAFLDGTDAIATHFPHHAFLIGEAKGRVHNYLNSIRPLPAIGKLPYDHDPDTSLKQKSYDMAVKLAHDPLTILDQVKNHSLTPEAMSHFKNLYPEIYNELSKRLTMKIAQTQIDKKMPEYSMRQTMSLFLGHPLDSTFLPQNILGAQPKPAQPTNPPKASHKGSMKTLDKLNAMYQTPEDKRDLRKSPS